MVNSVIKMGEILEPEKSRFPILVLSKEFFNATGMVVACPVVKNASEDALHIPVRTDRFEGIALLEQLKSLDMTARRYRKLGQLMFEQIQNCADAVQSIFDYYPYSVL